MLYFSMHLFTFKTMNAVFPFCCDFLMMYFIFLIANL